MWNSLLTNAIEHFIMFLFAFIISSLWSVCCPTFHWFVFFLWGSENLLHIQIQMFFQICDLQIVSSQSLACFFILLTVSFTEQKCLSLISVKFINFSFWIVLR